MDKTLTVTQDKVIAAADKCPSAKAVLETLFPEAFAQSKKFNIKALVLDDHSEGIYLFTTAQAKAAGFTDARFMQVRSGGEWRDRAFFLASEYNWRIELDNSTAVEALVLIPSRKL